MRNRQDVLILSPDRDGIQCDWEHTRPLHLCAVFPVAGRWLLRRALKVRPILLKERPDTVHSGRECSNQTESNPEERPAVSFIIGHRGMERLPHLLATLRSIAGQTGVGFECIVVEQDNEPLVRDRLPAWVRYVHTPLPENNLPYNRSWAFNEAAQVARGDVLILHDNDLMVSHDYAAESVRAYQAGYEVAQLKRFIFYLNEVDSTQLMSMEKISSGICSDYVIENACGGGSIAISRKVYWDIGGMDEAFVGWGGEDQEFWDRCLTRKVWHYAMLPIIHLWHAPQLGKRAINGNGALTAELTAQRRAIPALERIEELKTRNLGASVGFK